MRKLRRRLEMGALAILVLAARGEAQASDPGERLEIRALFEDESFRSGGPRQSRVIELYGEALEGGNAEVFRETQRQVFLLIDRHLVDPNAFTEFYPDIQKLGRKESRYEDGSEWTAGLREKCLLWNLTPRDREALYRRAIEPRTSQRALPGGQLGEVSWLNAASLGLLEQMDSLVPAIEGRLAATKEDQFNGSEVAYLRSVLLPLARARIAGDWMTGYLELIRKAVRLERTGAPEVDYSDMLAHEALRELVQKGRTDALDDLTAVWGDASRSRVSRVGDVGEERPTLWRDPGSVVLVRAIRALGRPTFEEATWREWYRRTPADSRKALVERGVLKPRHANR